MPAKKTTKRKPARASHQTESGIHPLGKLFFIASAIMVVVFLILILTQGARQPKPPAGRLVSGNAELQVALSREGFSPGSIDGKLGGQTKQALTAYQQAHGLDETGVLDEATAYKLRIFDPVFAQIELTQRDFYKVAPKPQSWVERGQVDAMSYNSILEMISEHAQTDPDFVKALNPSLNWHALQPGDRIMVPHVSPFRIDTEIQYVRIQLSSRTLQAFDGNDQLRFHCPVSIARRVDKRPSGQLAVKVLVEDPNYTFNPAILANTAAREGITQKFVIQPGPNNPVGSVWIGLNLPSYGMHGTPEPEKVGRTESSGCFRLANWNAKTLVKAAWVNMPVHVSP